MNDMQRITIAGMRHAEPMKDPETKRSLDCVTEQGMADAVELGRHYVYLGNVIGFHSGMNRAAQTLAGINVGMERAMEKYQAMPNALGLDFAKGADLPSGVAYGPDWIAYLLENNPGIADRVGQEMELFVRQAYREGVNGGEKDALVLGISHGPKIEVGYGMLMGLPESEIPELAANPLDGFDIIVDTHKKSGSIDACTIGYKNQKFEKLDSGLFAPKD